MDDTKINIHPAFYCKKFYHVYNKAVENNLIFYSSENYKYFLKKYDFYLNDIVETFAFCLLPNHFHFLISPCIDDPKRVSRKFQRLFVSYSMALNRQRGRKGNLFQKNFKRKMIIDKETLKRVVHYIHVNSFHHNLTADFEKYAYSSFRILDSRYTHLKRQEVLEWFGGSEKFISYHRKNKREIWKEFYDS